MSNTHFDCRMDLDGYIFQNVDFSGSNFRRNVNISRSLFLGHVILDDSIFSQLLTFDRGKCRNSFSMSGAKALGRVKMIKVGFAGEIELDRCDFRQNFHFNNLKCDGNVALSKSIFHGKTAFHGLEIAGEFIANDITLSGEATFQSSSFGQTASFSRSRFMSKVSFHRAKFAGEQLFYQVNFLDDLSLNSAEFSGPSFWNDTVFSKPQIGQALGPDFRNARWKSHANFAETTFRHNYPRLSGATFEEGATFSANDEHWPKRIAGTDEAAIAIECKETTAKLRHLMSKQGLPDDEHFFFRREMRFASQIGTPLERLPYQAFGWFSNFGQSIAFPVRALGEVFFIGMVALLGFFGPTLGWLKAFGLASAISFSNLLPLFGFGRTFLKDQLLDLPWALQFLSSAQTVLALPLLFFLGLALRKRFRLR